MTPATTTERPPTGSSVGLPPRLVRAPSSAAGRLFSPQQLSLLLGFSPAWLRRQIPLTTLGRYAEADVVLWLNTHRLCGRPFRLVTRLLSPAECAEYAPAAGSAITWRRRMADAHLGQAILTPGGEYRATLDGAARWLDDHAF